MNVCLWTVMRSNQNIIIIFIPNIIIIFHTKQGYIATKKQEVTKSERNCDIIIEEKRQ